MSWDAVSFDFHHPSEHTVDGEFFDLEMVVKSNPTFNGPESKFSHSSIRVLFSVKNSTANLTTLEDKVIDSFFESL